MKLNKTTESNLAVFQFLGFYIEHWKVLAGSIPGI
jgi:hypothetical protein